MKRRWLLLLLLSPLAGAQEVERAPQGWTCVASEEGWRCKLVGPPPRGRRVEVEERRFLARSFTDTDEERFLELLHRVEENPWERYCSARTTGLGGPLPPSPEGPIEVEADFSESLGEGLNLLSGNVVGRWRGVEVRADRALYDSSSETVHAWGGVLLRRRDLLLRSESAFWDLRHDQIRLFQTRFLLLSEPARGKAERSLFEGRFLSHHYRVRYTTCPPGREDWVALARSLKVDRKSGIATAYHARLRLFGLPLFYTPYLAHPIDDRRMTGFLSPSFGRSESTGIDLSLPFYLNLAPNYDLTLTPRVMTNRGFMAGAEFRYLLPWSQGRIAGAVIPFDYERKRWRGEIAFRSTTQPLQNLSLWTDIHFVSDRHYRNEIGDSLAVATDRHLRSEVAGRLALPKGELQLRAENYQTVDPRIPAKARPYRRLPQLLFLWRERPFSWLALDLDSEAVYFHREERVRGLRLDLRPTLALPWQGFGLSLLPKVQLAWTHYSLQHSPVSRRSRLVPIASLDLRTGFERSFGDLFLQTLEPHLFYVFIPRVNQDDLPLFDTAQYDFNFSQLFRENRFAGRDRIGDTHRVSFGLSSRLLSQRDGRELLRLDLGQSYAFRREKVVLPGEVPEERHLSNAIVQLSFHPHPFWSLRGDWQWDPEENRLARVGWWARFRRDNDHILNLGYRVRRGIVQIVDGSFRWELLPGLYGIGRWQHDLRNRIILDLFGGVEWETCCLRLSLLGRHFVRNIGRDTDQAIYAQLELKGLVQLGKRVDRFLERSIPGYWPEEE